MGNMPELMKATLGDITGEGYAEIHKGPYGMKTVSGGFKPSDTAVVDREDLAVGEPVAFTGVVYQCNEAEVVKDLEVEITSLEGDIIKFYATERQLEQPKG